MDSILWKPFIYSSDVYACVLFPITCKKINVCVRAASLDLFEKSLNAFTLSLSLQSLPSQHFMTMFRLSLQHTFLFIFLTRICALMLIVIVKSDGSS